MAKGKHVVGLDNHTSFVRAFRGGELDGTATPITRGSRTQLWEVTLKNSDGQIIATGRVRLLALDPDAGSKRRKSCLSARASDQLLGAPDKIHDSMATSSPGLRAK